MKGRALAWPVLAVLLVALGLQTVRWRDRSAAGKALWQVEQVSIAALARGRADPRLFRANLEALRRAGSLDPLEVGIPIATGSQHLVLGQPGAAVRAYEEALALEPRPEAYLNLGRARRMAGEDEAARRAFAAAARLDPSLRREIPPDAR
jgi:tetratricopeptide (TPR) repeat protein